MGRTLRKNLKKCQLAPFMVYLIRRWKNNTEMSKFNSEIKKSTTSESISNKKSWADWDNDDNELPDLDSFIFSPPKNHWKICVDLPVSSSLITPIKEYNYKNS